MQSKEEHTSLIRKLKTGDGNAFEQVYHMYKRPLYAIALRYLKDQQLAEEALQDIFVKLWKSCRALDEHQSLESFLFVCMKNHVLNMIRKEKARIKAATIACQTKENSCYQTESDVAHNDLQAHLSLCMKALPARKKHIVQLSIIEGYSNQEIATSLHISENTVRSQLSQAKKVLRHFLRYSLPMFVLFYF